MAKFSFNTPGSSVDREVRAELDYVPLKTLTAKLRVPGKDLHLQGSVQRTDAKSTGRFSLTIDQQEQYALTGSLEVLFKCTFLF